MVSRLMLNLRDPRLLLHGNGSGPGHGDETTVDGYELYQRDNYGEHGMITTVLVGSSSSAHQNGEG